MQWFDYILMALIGGGAVWIVIRTLFKDGQVQCPGCDAECSMKHSRPGVAQSRPVLEVMPWDRK